MKRIQATGLLILLGLCFAGPMLPAHAAGRHSMSFVPGERARSAGRGSHGAGRARSTRYASRHAAHGHRGGGGRPAAARGERDGGDAGDARAIPGGGFTLQDGVLTYPAPARFQPKNLRHR